MAIRGARAPTDAPTRSARAAPCFAADATGGADPTLVVAGSGFWDISSWWWHEANFSKSFHIGAEHVHAYLRGVRAMVDEVRRVLPRSLPPPLPCPAFDRPASLYPFRALVRPRAKIHHGL